MAQVKLNLDKLAVTEKIQLARDISAAMNHNTSFPAPNPTLATLTALADALEAAATAKADADADARQATIAQRAAEQALDAGLTTEAATVQAVSGGDESMIISAGMDVRAANQRRGTLPAPSSLNASAGDLPGEIDLHWDNVDGKSSYALRMTPDPLSPTSVWTTLPGSTKSKSSVPNLTPGTRYWFEVAAVGAAGQGPWSAPATKMAQG